MVALAESDATGNAMFVDDWFFTLRVTFIFFLKLLVCRFALDVGLSLLV